MFIHLRRARVRVNHHALHHLWCSPSVEGGDGALLAGFGSEGGLLFDWGIFLEKNQSDMRESDANPVDEECVYEL